MGIDLGDRSSRYCILNQEGEVVAASAVATTRKDLSRVFGALRQQPPGAGGNNIRKAPC
jgi:hypothetical protein